MNPAENQSVAEHRSVMDRLMLLLLITGVWGLMVLMEKVMPQLSAVILILSFMSIYAWLLSAAIIDQKRREWRKPKKVNTTYLPKVSILVPCHNEALVIAGTVKTLMALDYPNFDLLIIDDRSTDETSKVLEGLKQVYPERFSYWTRPTGSFPGKSAVLNEALSLVDGEIICVFDADAFMEPDFLKNIIPFLADEEVGAVQARKIIANASHNILTRCQDYEYSLDAHFQCGRDSIRGAVELRGNGQLVKREALESVGGWNNYTLTDDLDLSTKLNLDGWDIRFAHKVLVWEEGITRFLPLLRQRRRWAEGSLRRYLQYASSLLFSTSVSLKTKADMIAYFVEFLFPLWVVSDYVLLGLDMLTGDATRGHLISSLILFPLLTVFFITGLVVAIIRFNRPNLIEATTGAIMTGLYMTWVWMPIVFWIMIKVLFQRQISMNWGKTEHYGGTTTPAMAYAGSQPSVGE